METRLRAHSEGGELRKKETAEVETRIQGKLEDVGNGKLVTKQDKEWKCTGRKRLKKRD